MGHLMHRSQIPGLSLCHMDFSPVSNFPMTEFVIFSNFSFGFLNFFCVYAANTSFQVNQIIIVVKPQEKRKE